MKVKIKKYLMLLTMVVGIFLSTAAPAFAYTGGAEQETGASDAGAGTATGNVSTETEDTENTEDAPVTEEPSDSEDEAEEETPGRVNGANFSVPGNGQLVDDLGEDDSKQFLTIQTKNGNTFFMVLDRSNNTENVYMLSMIDENDLAEFIGDEKKETEQEQPSVVIPETEKPSVSAEPEAETETKAEAEEKKGGMGSGAMLAVVLLLAGVIGGFYYFKVWKPKQDEDESEGEDLEFYDGGAYVNEDQEDSDDEGEEK